MVGIAIEPDEVDRRIEERFAGWMAAGLLEEVRALAASPEGLSRTARQALGYRELLGHIEGGRDLGECVEEAVRRTRTLARRQASWFRRDPESSGPNRGSPPSPCWTSSSTCTNRPMTCENG